jgi:hypothetical protein
MINKYFTDKDVRRYVSLEKKRLKIRRHRDLLKIVLAILEELRAEENPNKWQIKFYEAARDVLDKKKHGKYKRSLNRCKTH